jgi:nucleoside-diphosphate kinase
MSLTLGIIKPDAVQSGKAGNILAHLEASGFTVRALEMKRLSTVQASAFYAVHKERPFFDSLVGFMTSGAVIPMVLEADDAVAKLRTVIGATDPSEADDGTIRKLFAESKERNAIHASDSDQNAASEIAFFFSEYQRLAL